MPEAQARSKTIVLEDYVDYAISIAVKYHRWLSQQGYYFDLDDLISEALLALYRHHSEYQPDHPSGASPTTFLNTAILRKLKSRVRYLTNSKRMPAQTVFVLWDEHDGASEETNQRPTEDAVIKGENRHWLDKQIQALPPNQQEVLLAKLNPLDPAGNQTSLKVISEFLGVPLKTVQRRWETGRDALRAAAAQVET